MTDTQHILSHRRPLEELNLLDDFLFQQLLLQEGDGEEFCRILLSTILGRKIQKVRIIPQKSVPGIDTNLHGIRMDAYIEDISQSKIDIVESTKHIADNLNNQSIPDIYDIEPNNKYEKHSLPRRMRYYHGLIDTQLLTTNTAYDNLPNIVTIVILPYDPFGKKRMVYTIKNMCVEDTSIDYDDGAKKIFLYTKGTQGNPSQELKDMLQYIERTVDDNVTNQNIDTIHQFVKKVKHRKEVGINYMKSWEIEQMQREEGFAIGHAEGLEQGLEQGLQQGIANFITACQELHLSAEDIYTKLVEKFSLPPGDANNYLQQYWKKS